MTSGAQGLRVENVLQTGDSVDVDQQMTTFGDQLLNIGAAIVGHVASLENAEAGWREVLRPNY